MFAFMESQKSSTKYHRRRTYKKDDDRFARLQGVDYPVDARCSETRTPIAESSKEVFVPWSIQGIDDFIESLDEKLRNPLRYVYIYGRKREDSTIETFWLDRAELAVMNRK